MSDVKWGDEVQSGDVFKFEKVGTVLQGVFKGKEQRNLPKGMAWVYEIRTKDGLVAVFGSGDIDRKMVEIQPGVLLQLTYKELKKTTSGNDYKVFSVRSTENTEENRTALGITIFKEEAENDEAEKEANDAFAGVTSGDEKK